MAPLVVPKQLNKSKAFLDSVLAKVPEAERDSVRALYSQAQDEVAGIARELEAGIGTVNATATKQGEWYEKHKDVIEGRAAGGGDNRITTAVDGDKITKDLTAQLSATREELAGQGLFLASVIPTIIAQHGVEFGEVLDGEKLVKDAVAAGTDLKTFYNGSVATRRAEKAAAARTADIAAAEARGREAGMREAGNGHIPFPVGNRTPTTLSGLRATPEQRAAAAGEHTLEAAVATATGMMNRAAG